jgi:hypothetical protein
MMRRLLCFQAVVLIAPLLAVHCESRRARALGGNWTIEYVTSATPEPGRTRGDLVAIQRKEHDVVDRYVWDARYYRDDCVGYHRSRPAGDEVLFVCGNHQPILLARESNPDAWTFQDGGLRKVTSRGASHGAPIDQGVRFTTERLKGTAIQTPRRTFSAAGSAFVDVRNTLVPEAFTAHLASDPNRRDYGGYTLLMNAVIDRNAERVAALIRSGADVKARTSTSLTALHLARTPDIAKLLIDADADINATDDNHATPLLYVAKEGEADVVRVLLDAHADYTIRTDPGAGGDTPLSWATKNRHEEIARMLRDAGARE